MMQDVELDIVVLIVDQVLAWRMQVKQNGLKKLLFTVGKVQNKLALIDVNLKGGHL